MNQNDSGKCKVELINVESSGEESSIREIQEPSNASSIVGGDEAQKEVFINDLSAICDLDRNTAECLLQEHNWDMQAAIDYFLEKSRDGDNECMVVEEGTNSLNEKCGTSGACPTVAFASDDSPEIVEVGQSPKHRSTKSNNAEMELLSDASSSVSPSQSSGFSTWAPEKFSIISWNLDGLDEKNLEKRTEAVLAQLLRENHAIIFLQELIPETFQYLANHLISKYAIAIGTADSSAQYFTATLLRRNHVIYESHEILPYPSTTMGRNLLITKGFIGRAKLCLLNSHLESTADFATERQNQLQFCFATCASYPPEYNVIFGGDLNLRDKEVANIPRNMVDLWIRCGSRESCKYTWDLTRNTNKQMPSRYQPRLRFDRLYFRTSEPETLTPEFFGVSGIEKVAGTQSFPSDHWAILAFLKVAHEARKPIPKKRKAENSPNRESH